MKKNDIKLIITVLVIAAGIFAFWQWKQNKSEPDWVVVTIEGNEYARYPLNQDATYTIEPHTGEENVLVIQDGNVEIKDANCSDRICIYQGKISKNGELIVCLPHGLIVQVESSEESVNDSVVK